MTVEEKVQETESSRILQYHFKSRENEQYRHPTINNNHLPAGLSKQSFPKERAYICSQHFIRFVNIFLLSEKPFEHFIS